MSLPQIDTDVRIVPFVLSDQAEVLEVILPIQQEEFAIPITAEDQPDLLAIADFYQTGTGVSGWRKLPGVSSERSG